jgi:hypothetical protein
VAIDPAPQADLPVQSLEHETSYRDVIDVQFVSGALASGARRFRGARWATQALYPGDGAEVIASAYYHYNRSFEALATVDDALAHIIRHGDAVTVRLAATDQAALDRAEQRLRVQLPEPKPSVSHRVEAEFSYWRGLAGVDVTSRSVAVPTLTEIEANYPRHIRSSLAELASGFRPETEGRLLLWHGLPGSGKTWALRALASEWRSWCKLRYVSDPECLLKEPAYLIDLIHTRPELAPDGRDWRLVVLEDTGELLSADAIQHADQGLSRLLNVADGLRAQLRRRELPGQVGGESSTREWR